MFLLTFRYESIFSESISYLNYKHLSATLFLNKKRREKPGKMLIICTNVLEIKMNFSLIIWTECPNRPKLKYPNKRMIFFYEFSTISRLIYQHAFIEMKITQVGLWLYLEIPRWVCVFWLLRNPSKRKK